MISHNENKKHNSEYPNHIFIQSNQDLQTGVVYICLTCNLLITP